MSSIQTITHIRPRFEFVIAMAPDELLRRIAESLQEPPGCVRGHIAEHHVVLDVVEEERHYWSPQMQFRVEPLADDVDHSMVRGLVGPRPAVWTMFMFVYFSIGALGFFISCFGISRWMLGEWSNLVLALPLAGLFMATAYFSGKYGETLGRDQIEEMKDFLRKALNTTVLEEEL